MSKIDDFKKAYDLVGLCFYLKNGNYHCKYSSEKDDISDEDMDFLMKALSAQQARIYFDDVGGYCFGMDGLRSKYLLLRLAGL